MLKYLLERQAALNKRIGYDTKALRNGFDPDTAGKWLNDYVSAASNELEDLRDCTLRSSVFCFSGSVWPSASG